MAEPKPSADPTQALGGAGVLGKGTLSRQLILSTTALVAVIAILLSGLTALSMHRILEGQIDAQIINSASRFRGDTGDRGGAFGQPGGAGQQQGLLYYLQGFDGIVQVGRERERLSADVTAQLDTLTPSDQLVTLNLPELGDYRLYASTVTGTANGVRGTFVLITGQSTDFLKTSMTSLLVAATVLTLLAIAIAFIAARTVVERSLRPLARLTATANHVSRMPLHSGEVAVPVRVPDADVDPRSEVGQVGLAFNHMLDNVEGALAARQRSETKVRQFVADASHELRNPLASIRGYAELTRRERAHLPDTTAHALGRIESESERMSRLVEDLLLLARLDSGPELALLPTSLNQVVANAVSDARAAGPDHIWTLDLPDADVLAQGDPYRLTQVVANLLANARTHTPAGTRVHASVAADGPDAVVTVTDDGPGIPRELLDRVFERFTRADASRVRSGAGGQSTGLGLAIVAAVVGAHHGRVEVASRPGLTAFTVRLPRADADGPPYANRP